MPEIDNSGKTIYPTTGAAIREAEEEQNDIAEGVDSLKEVFLKGTTPLEEITVTKQMLEDHNDAEHKRFLDAANNDEWDKLQKATDATALNANTAVKEIDEKFVSPEPQPNAYQRELLTILIEEAGEVIQRATKSLRFGINETQPGQPFDNAYRLGLEVGDFEVLKNMCLVEGLICPEGISISLLLKPARVKKYLQNPKFSRGGA